MTPDDLLRALPPETASAVRLGADVAVVVDGDSSWRRVSVVYSGRVVVDDLVSLFVSVARRGEYRPAGVIGRIIELVDPSSGAYRMLIGSAVYTALPPVSRSLGIELRRRSEWT